MALSTALFSAVSGLSNHQTMLDVIGNNVANVNTIGYKSQRVTFSDTFNQFIQTGTNPTSKTGGANTVQIGLGTKVNSIDRDWTQGTSESTSTATDLALQGDAMFVLKKNGQTYYSRAGNFSFDANGNMISGNTGAVVQGKLANSEGVVAPGNSLEDIQLDTNMKLPAVATTEISWGGNLQSDSDLTRTQTVTQSGNINSSSLAVGDTSDETTTTIYDEYGKEYTLSITYTKTAATAADASASPAVLQSDTYTMDWTLTDSSDTEVTTGSLTGLVFTDDGTGSVVMDTASQAKFDAAANRVNVPDSNIDFTIEATKVTSNSATSTLSMSADNKDSSNVVSGSVTVYDSLGTATTVTLQFTKIADNTWIWSASVPATSTSDGKAVETSGTIKFNSDGSLDTANISPSEPSISFNPAGGANTSTISLDFGSAFSGVTQTSSSSVISSLSQDGSATASLSSTSVDSYGNIVGVFSNGSSRTLAQIMVATFSNENGLTSVGDSMFTANANSGDTVIGSLGEETNTTVQSNALEQSNVDLSDEFSKMIVAQRGYQANARVVTTADSLLQEVTNLVR
jgi:flagellar hook protein FlgE